ncbi:MAG TPA: rhodanese-like domain-containing protein [Cyclobacteriaceae bacterium]|nr:rhodanese-like domain-containing protein [Cyclobacteriaceae bacterium]
MKKLFIFLVVFACSEKKTDALLSPNDFDSKYKATQNAILLDVRTVEEVNAGALAGAVNIVYDNAFADKLGTLEHKPIFVYCGSGIRSAKAAAILREKGYDPVFEMEGGMKAWKAAGLPVQ